MTTPPNNPACGSTPSLAPIPGWCDRCLPKPNNRVSGVTVIGVTVLGVRVIGVRMIGVRVIGARVLGVKVIGGYGHRG